jgi:hypothetical protein
MTIHEATRAVLITDGPKITRWVAELIAEIKANHRIELVAILELTANTRHSLPLAIRILSYIRKLFYHYAPFPDPLDTADIDSNRIAVTKFSELPHLIADYGQIDVILNASPSLKNEPHLSVVSADIWNLHQFLHVSAPPYQRLLAGYINNLSEFGVTVIKNTKEGSMGIVCATWCQYEPLWLSVNEKRFYATLKRLILKSLCRPRTTVQHHDLALSEILTSSQVSTGAILSILPRYIFRRLNASFNYHLRRKQWFLAYRLDSREFVKNTDEAYISGLRIISPPPNHFYADPFPVTEEGRHYVFFEDYDYQKAKGLLAYLTIEANGTISSPKIILEQHYHLSYPYIFKHRGQHYMIPETSANRTVDLYIAESFPDQWKYKCTLMSGIQAVDATLFRHQDRFWMFAGVAEEGQPASEDLHLFFSKRIEGPWHPHPLNPVVSDIRHARPAGKIFYRGNDLIRPSQNCSKAYGYSILLNRIKVLSKAEYEEETIESILPDWHPNMLATHTLNSTDDIEVLDGRRYVWKFFD